MIRVGFVMEGPSFQGSVNYVRNLFAALAKSDDHSIVPVLFVGHTMPATVTSHFPEAQVVRSSMLDGGTWSSRIRRRLRRLAGPRDPMLTWLLRRHDIQVLSHSVALPGRSIRTIGWIPDFQHVHLPTFFNETERRARDADFAQVMEACDRVVLSSVAARDDMRAYAPHALTKTSVLRFVPAVEAGAPVVSLDELERLYGFSAPYFYMPNQFWIHKNHRIVIEALGKLEARGVTATVLMTGSTEDYRHPEHYKTLLSRAKQLGVQDSFRVLGMVPYPHLLSLMHHAVAVLNPSLFEGWSSSVEEAKALDKTIVLSNLPVHIEQAPARGVFFDPANADDLADKLQVVLRTAQPGDRAPRGLTLSAAYADEQQRFAETYQRIVHEVVEAQS